MLEKTKNLLLYAGISKEEYERIKPKIIESNRVMTIAVSGFATAMILVMLVSSLFIKDVRMNRFIYTIGLIISLALFVVSFFFKKYDSFVTPLMMFSYSVYYIYGIVIGTIIDPTNKTAMFIVMLVFLPSVFTDRPVHAMSISLLYIAVFICLCFFTKTGEVLWNDILNSIAFGILGMSSGTLTSKKNVEKCLQEAKLQELSEIDTLTKLRSRGAYDMEFYNMPEKCKKRLCCVFIDVNGLKHINDTYGHKRGDKMLKFVADKIRKFFGDEMSYRIGGDEFVVFVPDPQDFEIKTIVDEMITEIKRGGYHVAVGWKINKIERISMAALVGEAESKMYQKKAEFYKNSVKLFF